VGNLKVIYVTKRWLTPLQYRLPYSWTFLYTSGYKASSYKTISKRLSEFRFHQCWAL